MYLVLATDERIDYLYDSGIGNIVAEYETSEEASADINKFTEEAVKEVSFFNDDDTKTATYYDLVFPGASVKPEDDAYYCTFHLREKTDIEKRFDALEARVDELDPSKTMILMGGELDDVTILAGDTRTIEIPLEIPGGYRLGGFREISIDNATENGQGKEWADIRWWGSTNEGKSANVAIMNNAATKAAIKVKVTALLVKGE